MKERGYYPQRWEEVPLEVYDPAHRLEALDRDRVDAEVLFPNGPGGTFFYGDPAFELDCVRAYNDALAEFRRVSDRFIPLAAVPYMSPIETIVGEVERAVQCRPYGHQHFGGSERRGERSQKSQRSFLASVVECLPGNGRRHTLARVRRARWKTVIAAMERLHAATVALRVDAAQFLHGHADSCRI